MENHKFKSIAWSLRCGICYKPKLDELHLNDLDDKDIRPSNLPTVNAEKHYTEETEVLNGKPLVPEENGQMSLIFPMMDKGTPSNKQEPDCYGHTCPVCGIYWVHGYKCWPDPKIRENMHCSSCFGQANVEINRSSHLEEIMHEQGKATPLNELARIRLEHESFCVLEAVRDTSVPYQDWFKRHLADFRSRMEKLAEQEKGARLAWLRLEKEELAKLTPEEITDYRRRASRQKKVEGEKKKSEDKENYNKLLKQLITAIGNEEIAKEQVKVIYKAQGKEIPGEIK